MPTYYGSCDDCPPHPATPEDAARACTLPPAGWWCSRERGHDGPCAARRRLPGICLRCGTIRVATPTRWTKADVVTPEENDAKVYRAPTLSYWTDAALRQIRRDRLVADAIAGLIQPTYEDRAPAPPVGEAPRDERSVSSRETEGVLARWRAVSELPSARPADAGDGPASSALPQQRWTKYFLKSRVAVPPLPRRRARAAIADLVQRCRRAGRGLILLARAVERRRARRAAASRMEKLALDARVTAALAKRKERLDLRMPISIVNLLFQIEVTRAIEGRS
jgi:hypothetical protein